MISFIVPAHNEECLIGGTLAALHAAAGAVNEPYEIVVVDDASTDGTSTLAAGYGARVLAVHHRKIGAARNAGAAQAQGDLFVFVDADTHVTGAVVLRPCTQCASAQSAAVRGHGLMGVCHFTGVFSRGYGSGSSGSGISHRVVSSSVRVQHLRLSLDSTRPCTLPRILSLADDSGVWVDS